MPRVSPEKLTQFAGRLLESVGTAVDAARRVAEHLVDANLTGHDSHGVLRLEGYLEHIDTGYVRPTESPEVIRETATTAVVDGRRAWGPIVAHYAMEIALRKAAEYALSAVSVRNCYHIGRVGVYPLEAALKGYVGVAFCNVHGSARAAPWGGLERRMATNPIAFAIPTGGLPIVTDFATTAVAEGKVREAQINGNQVPEGWLLDGEGESSRDPNDLYLEGSLVPLGGDQGHKGYSLAVAMDLLGGILSGSGSALMTQNYGNGLLLQVIDPAAFTDPEEYRQRIQAYTEYVRSARRRSTVDRILLPGEIEAARAEKNRRNGIEVPQAVWDRLESLAAKHGVEFPAVSAASVRSEDGSDGQGGR